MGFRGDVRNVVAAKNFLDGIGTTFTEGHVVFFGTTFVTVTNDLNGADIGTGAEAIGVLFDDGFSIGTDRRFVEVEVSDARLANRSVYAMLIAADLTGRAVFIGEAFRFGDAAVIFADVIFRAILGDGFGIAFGTATTIAAFLTGRAIDADFGIAITVNALAGTAIADVAFIFFAGAVFVVTAFSTFCIQAIFIVGFTAHISFAIRIFIAFRIRR